MSKRFWNSYRRRAKTKGMEFELGYEDFMLLASLPCAYCGAEKSNAHGLNGLDRIDNSAGYVPKNIVVSCVFCNNLRAYIPFDVWASWLNAVVDRGQKFDVEKVDYKSKRYRRL